MTLPLNLIMLGPPGAGKGTQAERFARTREIPRVSTGDILREAIHNDTEIGRCVKATMYRGELVGDDIMTGIVRERLQRPDAQRGFVLDGFPRTVAQADALDRLLAEFGRHVGAIILLEAPREELLARLSGRARAEGRTDDTPEVIAKRLAVYEEQTRPVVSHYERRGLVRRVNGVGAVPDVTERLRDAADRGPG